MATVRLTVPGQVIFEVSIQATFRYKDDRTRPRHRYVSQQVGCRQHKVEIAIEQEQSCHGSEFTFPDVMNFRLKRDDKVIKKYNCDELQLNPSVSSAVDSEDVVIPAEASMQ